MTVAVLRVVPALKYIILMSLIPPALLPRRPRAQKKKRDTKWVVEVPSVIVMSLVLPRGAEPGR